uniref:Uncharacterized protein n=1 Tax=Arundo donax TaxID=35708 RepID=A0A0A9DXR2_ARUDO
MDLRRSCLSTHFFLCSATVSPHPWCLHWCYWQVRNPWTLLPQSTITVLSPYQIYLPQLASMRPSSMSVSLFKHLPNVQR